MLDSNCPSCGLPSRALDGWGAFYFFTETHVDGLLAFFARELDEVKCEGCQHPLGVRPTVFIRFADSGAVHVAPGSRIRDDPEATPHLRRLAKDAYLDLDENVSLHVFGSIDELRRAFVPQINPKLQKVAKVLREGVGGTLPQYLARHWKTLTPDVFAVGFLAVYSLLPGIKLVAEKPDGESAPPDEVVRMLARAQAIVWVLMCGEAVGRRQSADENQQDRSLETLLQTYVDKCFPLPGSLEIFGLPQPMKADWEDDRDKTNMGTDDLLRFCMEATSASLHAAAKQDNPRATQWASILFSLEMTYRVGKPAEARARLERFLISAERARKTVPFQAAWDVVAGWRNSPDLHPDSVEALHQISTKAGYPELHAQISKDGTRIHCTSSIPIEHWLEAVTEVAAAHGMADTTSILEASRTLADELIREGRVDDLEHYGDAVLQKMGDTIENRAEVHAWLGSYFKALRLPKRLLGRVGETAQAWEQDLDAKLRVRLWTERSNALRLLGRSLAALEVSYDIIRILPGDMHPRHRRVALLNHAILLRETGAPDVAIEILCALAQEVATPEADRSEKISVLHSLMASHTVTGNDEEVLRAADEALRYAVGPFADHAPKLRIGRAGALASLGRYKEAIETLLSPESPPANDPSLVLTEAAIWLNLLSNKVDLWPEAQERFARTTELIGLIHRQAEEAGDIPTLIGSIQVAADLLETTEDDKAEEMWQHLLDVAQRHNYPCEPVAFAALARHAYLRGEKEAAREHMLSIPKALALKVGASVDLGTVCDSSRALETTLDRLTPIMLGDQVDWEDIRLLAELRRDAVGRAQGLRRQLPEVDPPLAEGLPDGVVAGLAPAVGSLALVEWLSNTDMIAGFVTAIDSSGFVSSHWLEPPQITLGALAKRLGNRLANWYSGNPDDPFNIPEWGILQAWLSGQLLSRVPRGGHIVFIEHEEFEGIPWHVAAAPWWSSSYASGWTTLLALRRRPAEKSIASIGVGFAPRFREADEVLLPARRSVRRTEKLACGRGVHVLTAEEHMLDHEAFRKLMRETDVVKLICHGFVNSSHEVSLMLAHDGALPPTVSVAAGGEAGRGHRLSWRECQHLETAPRVIFSAGCSSGVSRTAGLGERLGLFSALRRAGTRAMVAPRWDIEPAFVLPILDDALERYVCDGTSLGQALHATCLAAEEGCPRWLAWALALEGDWR